MKYKEHGPTISRRGFLTASATIIAAIGIEAFIEKYIPSKEAPNSIKVLGSVERNHTRDGWDLSLTKLRLNQKTSVFMVPFESLNNPSSNWTSAQMVAVENIPTPPAGTVQADSSQLGFGAFRIMKSFWNKKELLTRNETVLIHPEHAELILDHAPPGAPSINVFLPRRENNLFVVSLSDNGIIDEKKSEVLLLGYTPEMDSHPMVFTL